MLVAVIVIAVIGIIPVIIRKKISKKYILHYSKKKMILRQ